MPLRDVYYGSRWSEHILNCDRPIALCDDCMRRFYTIEDLTEHVP